MPTLNAEYKGFMIVYIINYIVFDYLKLSTGIKLVKYTYKRSYEHYLHFF